MVYTATCLIEPFKGPAAEDPDLGDLKYAQIIGNGGGGAAARSWQARLGARLPKA